MKSSVWTKSNDANDSSSATSSHPLQAPLDHLTFAAIAHRSVRDRIRAEHPHRHRLPLRGDLPHRHRGGVRPCARAPADPQPAIPGRHVRKRVGLGHRGRVDWTHDQVLARRSAATDRRDVRRAARTARPRPRARPANATRGPSAGCRAGPHRLTRRPP